MLIWFIIPLPSLFTYVIYHFFHIISLYTLLSIIDVISYSVIFSHSCTVCVILFTYKICLSSRAFFNIQTGGICPPPVINFAPRVKRFLTPGKYPLLYRFSAMLSNNYCCHHVRYCNNCRTRDFISKLFTSKLDIYDSSKF